MLSRSLASLCARKSVAYLAGALLVPCCGDAQQWLDPIRNVAPERLTTHPHTPLPEQYIWLSQANSATDIHLTERPGIPVLFRRAFEVSVLPAQATLYVAQSGSADIFLNGTLLRPYPEDTAHGLHVSIFDVRQALHSGRNIVAIRVLAGMGSRHTTSNPAITQLTTGHVLVVKLLAAPRGSDGPPLVLSDLDWNARQASKDDSRDLAWTTENNTPASEHWSKVASNGAIESNLNFYQWNADAGLYDWPGYEGVSPFLRHLQLAPSRILHVEAGSGSFQNLDSLISGKGGPFRVSLGPESAPRESPSLMLDFGREVAGRIRIVSSFDQPSVVSVAYGESEEEAIKRPYLGVRSIYLPAHGTGLAPKSAFRYGYLRFPQDAVLDAINVDATTYPVEYRGSFRSSDDLLNRIWETGAYTAHLCMQDGIWDGVKRDRARWMGDLDVIGRTIDAVFAERPLMQDTLERLVRDRAPDSDVNSIHGYSPLWIAGVADFYRHTGDRKFLAGVKPDLLQLLTVMSAEFNDQGLFDPPHKHTIFVDWSEGLQKDSAESRRATDLEFAVGYREAIFLLNELGEKAAADAARAQLVRLTDGAQRFLRTPGEGPNSQTFGERWQTNAMAVYSGVAQPAQYDAIWKDVLSRVGTFTPATPPISPYYGFYVLQAMAKLGHVTEAVDWIKAFWGGMLAEGATSFWEVYDPRWPKQDFHSALEADNKIGYNTSLAHGWSSGPTPWLMQHVLGIDPVSPGFSSVVLHPDLAGLAWAEGSEPTPTGDLLVRLRQLDKRTISMHVELPANVNARLELRSPTMQVIIDGRPLKPLKSVQQDVTSYPLAHAGTYEIVLLDRSH